MSCNIVGNNQPYRLPFLYTCDGPGTGGIGGNFWQNRPNPFIMEERPSMVDPFTGQRVYVDEYMKNRPNICYMA